MGNQVKVSVIIPVYNAEKYLRECLDNLVNQTLREIEVLCIDDGSTDKSLKILREYEQNDPRVKVFTQENRGAGIARNTGINFAKGEYVAFLDSDDYYPRHDALSILYSAATNNGAEICGGSIQFLRKGVPVPGELEGEPYYFAEEGWLYYNTVQQDFYYQRFLYSLEMLRKNNILFPYYRRYQDPPFFVKAMLTAGKFYALPQVTYSYREGASNVVWTAEKIFDRLEGVIEELNLTRQAGLATLHFRVVQRIKRIFDAALREPTVSGTQQIRGAFERVRDAIDRDLIRGKGAVDLEFLDSYLNVENTAEEASADDGAEPKVSVVIPVYNVEAFLAECLDSIVAQTLHDIEIICVNDGSTDSSLSILEQYAAQDERIRIITQKNGGLSAARNTGVCAARGKYIYFIDSDDYIDTGALAYLYQEAEKDSLDILFFDGESFYESEEAKAFFPGEDCCFRRKEFKEVYTGPALYAAMRKHGAYKPMAWLQLISRKYYLEKGLSFREGILHEDVLFTAASTLRAERASHRKKNFYRYRRRMGAITGTKTSFRHVYGQFVSLVGLAGMIMECDYGQEVELHMLRDFDWRKGEILSKYNTLSEEEKAKRHEMRPIEQSIFEMLMENMGAVTPESVVVTQTVEPSLQTSQLSDEVETLQKKVRWLEREVRVARKEIDNIHRSVTYRVGRVLTWFPRKVRGGIRCLREHSVKYTLQRVLVHLKLKPDPFKAPKPQRKETEKKSEKCSDGHTTLKKIDLPTIKHNGRRYTPKLYISLTSFPARIQYVSTVVESLLRQTVEADKIFLWLAKEQFPGKEKDLPKELLEYTKDGLEICWCEDLKPHKKYYYTMKQNPNDVVVTVDDDVYYPQDLLEKLVQSYIRYPNAVSCMRGHTIQMIDENTFAPYNDWKQGKKLVGVPSLLTLPTGVGGVLYPPHLLARQLFDKDKIQRLCPMTDDLWLKWMQLKNNVKCVVLGEYNGVKELEGSQREALWHENANKGKNDLAWKNIVDDDNGKTSGGQDIKKLLYQEYIQFFEE